MNYYPTRWYGALIGSIATHSEPNFVGPDPPAVNGTPGIAVAPPIKIDSLKILGSGSDLELEETAVNVAVQCVIDSSCPRRGE